MATLLTDGTRLFTRARPAGSPTCRPGSWNRQGCCFPSRRPYCFPRSMNRETSSTDVNSTPVPASSAMEPDTAVDMNNIRAERLRMVKEKVRNLVQYRSEGWVAAALSVLDRQNRMLLYLILIGTDEDAMGMIDLLLTREANAEIDAEIDAQINDDHDIKAAEPTSARASELTAMAPPKATGTDSRAQLPMLVERVRSLARHQSMHWVVAALRALDRQGPLVRLMVLTSRDSEAVDFINALLVQEAGVEDAFDYTPECYDIKLYVPHRDSKYLAQDLTNMSREDFATHVDVHNWLYLAVVDRMPDHVLKLSECPDAMVLDNLYLFDGIRLAVVVDNRQAEL